MNDQMKSFFGDDPSKPGSMLKFDVDSCKFALNYILQDEILVEMRSYMKNKIVQDLDRRGFDSEHMYEM